jgi:putative glycosyltransferase (TIGR04372 family)
LKNFLANQIYQIRIGGVKTFNSKLKKLFFLITYYVTAIFFFPIFFIIRLISNVVLIRFGELPSNRIGHFANDVHQYIYNLKEKNFFFTIDFFCLTKPICNYELVKIFKKDLFILPKILIFPFFLINKIKFIGSAKHNIILVPSTGRDLRDRSIVDNNHYRFDKKDILYGNSFLKNLGIKNDDKFICLIVRDGEYLKEHEPEKNWDYHNYRDCDIKNFEFVSNYLTGLGYYVFRMGAKVSKPMLTKNKKIIDYATIGIRNEFLDIFLSAHCEFGISTMLGFDSLIEMFNKPLVCVSGAPIGHIRSVNKKHLTIFKHHLSIKSHNRLTLSEIFELNLANALDSKNYENKGIILIENSPEEIKEATKEMLKLMQNNFSRDPTQEFLELKFWNIFNNKIKNYGPKDLHTRSFKAHIGENFLKNNMNFLN